MSENFLKNDLFHLLHVRKSDLKKWQSCKVYWIHFFIHQDLEQSPDKTIRIQDLVQQKNNSTPNQTTKPKAKIPEVKVTPSSKEQKMEPYPTQRTEAESPNQLSVPKTRKAKNKGSLGTTTMLLNPVHKNSASEVAKRSDKMLTKFTTCCPMLKPIKLVKNCYKWEKEIHYYYILYDKENIIC